MARLFTATFYGRDAQAIRDHLGLKYDGETTDLNTKVSVSYKSVEGRDKVTVSLEV